MNADLAIAVICVAAGMALGWWRGFAFAVKLTRFSVNLERWAGYTEREPIQPRLVERERVS
jgi:hypothetical protein